MLKLELKENFQVANLETGSLCLGYSEIIVFANLGTYPVGGDSLAVKADGRFTYLNSNDLIHNLEAYLPSEA